MKLAKNAICTLLILIMAFVVVMVFPVGKSGTAYASYEEGKALGIDVSSHNGTLNWKAVKEGGVEFAIIRIGFGDDIARQDDVMAEYNMSECEKYGIPYGVYIYSYALNLKEVDSEVAHTIRMIQGHNPVLGIWFDMEDADFYKENHNFSPYTHGTELTSFCLHYMRQMKKKGYSNVGVYANPDYFINVLNYNKIKAEGMIWLAHWYVDSPSYKCALWQYSAIGRISGASGEFDMNLIFSNSPLFELVVDVPLKVEILKRIAGVPMIRGDIDGDEIVSFSDLTQLKMRILGRLKFTGAAKKCADMNKNGVLTLADLTLLKQQILKSVAFTSEKKALTAPAEDPEQVGQEEKTDSKSAEDIVLTEKQDQVGKQDQTQNQEQALSVPESTETEYNEPESIAQEVPEENTEVKTENTEVKTENTETLPAQTDEEPEEPKEQALPSVEQTEPNLESTAGIEEEESPVSQN